MGLENLENAELELKGKKINKNTELKMNLWAFLVFVIIICGVFWFLMNMQKNHYEGREKMQEEYHKEQIQNITTKLNAFESTINSMGEDIDGLESSVSRMSGNLEVILGRTGTGTNTHIGGGVAGGGSN